SNSQVKEKKWRKHSQEVSNITALLWFSESRPENSQDHPNENYWRQNACLPAKKDERVQRVDMRLLIQCAAVEKKAAGWPVVYPIPIKHRKQKRQGDQNHHPEG